jgi:hypothetical protein
MILYGFASEQSREVDRLAGWLGTMRFLATWLLVGSFRALRNKANVGPVASKGLRGTPELRNEPKPKRWSWPGAAWSVDYRTNTAWPWRTRRSGVKKSGDANVSGTGEV